MTRTVTFHANDDAQRTWNVPKHGSPYLLIQAVNRWAKEGDEGLAAFGLTRSETVVVAEIVAWLLEHQRKAEAVA